MMINKGLMTRLHAQSSSPSFLSFITVIPFLNIITRVIAFSETNSHIPWRHQYSYILRAILSSQGCGRVGEKILPTISVFGISGAWIRETFLH